VEDAVEASDLAELIRRVAELEELVRLLVVVVAVLAAVLVVAGVLAIAWLRSRHADVMVGIKSLSSEHEEMREEIRTVELARSVRSREDALVH
jgi:hypothetical protein